MNVEQIPPEHKRQGNNLLERLQRLMAWYERFEQIVALILSLIITVVIVTALIQLVKNLWPLIIGGALDPLDHKVFQSLFGMIMTLLIAMEFKHSIVKAAMRHDSIIQVKTVIIIALIALSRKFVILDPDTDPTKIAALAIATLALGGVYWLLRERDDKLEALAADHSATSKA
jgi:uncharacterized membrane protein (DUF373 family)